MKKKLLFILSAAMVLAVGCNKSESTAEFVPPLVKSVSIEYSSDTEYDDKFEFEFEYDSSDRLSVYSMKEIYGSNTDSRKYELTYSDDSISATITDTDDGDSDGEFTIVLSLNADGNISSVVDDVDVYSFEYDSNSCLSSLTVDENTFVSYSWSNGSLNSLSYKSRDSSEDDYMEIGSVTAEYTTYLNNMSVDFAAYCTFGEINPLMSLCHLSGLESGFVGTKTKYLPSATNVKMYGVEGSYSYSYEFDADGLMTGYKMYVTGEEDGETLDNVLVLTATVGYYE